MRFVNTKNKTKKTVNNISKKVYNHSTKPTETQYLAGYQYISNVLQFFPTAEGYVNNTVVSGINQYSYVYNYTDHLGNIRLSYKKNGTALQILEENNYYPFGLKHTYYNTTNAQPNYKYKYNGKEYQDELGLNFYDYGARNYDASIGRWMNIDPLAEKYQSISPYNYCGNNPINNIDPNGRYFIGVNDKKVSFTLRKDGTIKLGRNASADLKRLVTSVNSSGSKIAIAQIMKASENETKIHTKIVTEKVDNGLLGLHQAHDNDGKPLNWDSKKGDFDGVPAYVEGKEGVYKEATITVFEGNIKESGGNGSYYGYNITESQEMANTFQHESNHNTDTEFIQDLKNKREGKPSKGIDAHDNIHPQEQKVYQEMQDHNKKKE